MLDLAVAGEHDQPLAGGEEVVDPRERGVELAARGEQLERVQPHEPLGAQRGRDLRVELAQVERLAAQPRDHVLLGEPVLGLVVELDRHDRCASSAAAAAGRRPSGAARSSVRAGASAGAGGRPGRGSAGRTARPSRSRSSRPRIRSWEISSAGRFITGVPVSASTSPSSGHRRAEPLDRLGALGRGVLAVVGLVEHERARRQRRAARPAARRRCRS